MIPAIAGGVTVLGLAVFAGLYIRRQRRLAALAKIAEALQAELDQQLQIIDGWIVERTRNPYWINLHCGTCDTSRFLINKYGLPIPDADVRWAIDNMPPCHDEEGVRLDESL